IDRFVHWCGRVEIYGKGLVVAAHVEVRGVVDGGVDVAIDEDAGGGRVVVDDPGISLASAKGALRRVGYLEEELAVGLGNRVAEHSHIHLGRAGAGRDGRRAARGKVISEGDAAAVRGSEIEGRIRAEEDVRINRESKGGRAVGLKLRDVAYGQDRVE